MGINWDKEVFGTKLWVWLMITPMLLMLIGGFWLSSKYEPEESQESDKNVYPINDSMRAIYKDILENPPKRLEFKNLPKDD